MAQVAFFLDTRRIRSVDLRDVDAGNPGVGGTEYMFFLVATHLARTHQVSMYVTAAGHHPPGIRIVVVRDMREAVVAMQSAGEEIVILRDSEVLPNQSLLSSMQQSVNVVYMGCLVRSKGFHVLARYWGDIVRAVPTARLHVVGTRRLYNEGAALGPLGLASPRYERQFARYVTEHGKLREDIVFHGILGADKWRLLREAKVGVTNPTGAGETFCISAAEFGQLGVPVVTRNVGGPIDVVESGASGILFDDERDLPEAVVGLLKDEDLRAWMGRNAMTRVRSRFDIEIVIEKWHRVIDGILGGDPVAAGL